VQRTSPVFPPLAAAPAAVNALLTLQLPDCLPAEAPPHDQQQQQQQQGSTLQLGPQSAQQPPQQRQRKGPAPQAPQRQPAARPVPQLDVQSQQPAEPDQPVADTRQQAAEPAQPAKTQQLEESQPAVAESPMSRMHPALGSAAAAPAILTPPAMVPAAAEDAPQKAGRAGLPATAPSSAEPCTAGRQASTSTLAAAAAESKGTGSDSSKELARQPPAASSAMQREGRKPSQRKSNGRAAQTAPGSSSPNSTPKVLQLSSDAPAIMHSSGCTHPADLHATAQDPAPTTLAVIQS